jgi:hypothetical protein
LISATRSFRQPSITHNYRQKGIRISGQNVQKCEFSTAAPAVSWNSISLGRNIGAEDPVDAVSLAGNLRFCLRRPHGCAVSVPRHYSASLGSDAAIDHLSSLEPSIKPSAEKALSLIQWSVRRRPMPA